jgi:hypothetical protein
VRSAALFVKREIVEWLQYSRGWISLFVKERGCEVLKYSGAWMSLLPSDVWGGGKAGA